MTPFFEILCFVKEREKGERGGKKGKPTFAKKRSPLEEKNKRSGRKGRRGEIRRVEF